MAISFISVYASILTKLIGYRLSMVLIIFLYQECIKLDQQVLQLLWFGMEGRTEGRTDGMDGQTDNTKPAKDIHHTKSSEEHLQPEMEN